MTVYGIMLGYERESFKIYTHGKLNKMQISVGLNGKKWTMRWSSSSPCCNSFIGKLESKYSTIIYTNWRGWYRSSKSIFDSFLYNNANSSSLLHFTSQLRLGAPKAFSVKINQRLSLKNGHTQSEDDQRGWPFTWVKVMTLKTPFSTWALSTELVTS